MNENAAAAIVEEISSSIDIPDSAYEKAEKRYKDLGEWFGRQDAHCAAFEPQIYPQGSFRLGTVVLSDEYDLDLGCRLHTGISKATHSQQALKALVGHDMETYRVARHIQNRLEEKHRCWRLQYADELSFHMDAVPSIPTESAQRQLLEKRMIVAGTTDLLARNVSALAGEITDNRLPNYALISPDWRISNSEGYAKWFESRMKLAESFLAARAIIEKVGQVDDLPARKWKSPLQRSVQLLKRHRDVMFAENPDAKPISIVITTLAAEAYQGEQDVRSALKNILERMDKFVRPVAPRVPNPVNPIEDFADKWPDRKYAHLRLEENFKLWLAQAQADLHVIGSASDPGFLAGKINARFGVAVDAGKVRTILGSSGVPVVPKTHVLVESPPKPWAR